MLFQRLLKVPNSETSLTSGSKSLLRSLLNTTESVSSSPKTKSPPNVISPVACIFPSEFQLEYISTVPVPFGVRLILLSDNERKVLKLTLKLSVNNPDRNTLLLPLKFISPLF